MTEHHDYRLPRPAAGDSSRKRQRTEGKRLRDWAAEDAAAVRRGRLDIYISKDAFARPPRTGKRGRPALYSRSLIWSAALLRKLERQAFRPLSGRLEWLAEVFGITESTPHYSTLNRRIESVALPPLPKPAGRRTVVVDSTGISCYGAGQWRALRDKDRIQREYLKLHVVRDLDTGEILDWALTRSEGYGSSDPLVAGWMLDSLTNEGFRIERAYADGAYDSELFRAAVWRGGGHAIVPPKSNARLSRALNRDAPQANWQLERDEQILACRENRDDWKNQAGYHARSTIETSMSRLKTLLGDRLTTQTPERQRTDIAAAIHILNQTVVRSSA